MSTPLNGSVLKAFAILRLITPERPEITASTVATEFGMNTATAHRFLLTLEECGALVSHRRGYFSLGIMAQELGRIAEITNPLAARLQPVVTDLAKRLHESVMICRLGRRGPTCIVMASADRPITVNINVGTVLPIAVTAHGKIWLANMDEDERKRWRHDGPLPPREDLEEAKALGYARNTGENEPDIGALAVPIRRKSGEVALTLSAFGMLSRFNDALVEKALPELQATASEIQV